MRLSRGEPLPGTASDAAGAAWGNVGKTDAQPFHPLHGDVRERPAAEVAALDAGVSANTDPLALGAPLPKSLGRCADLFHDVRELRLLMEKECAAIKARETEIQEHVIRSLPKGDTGASGLRYRAQINTDDKPQVSDEKGGWPALWAHIQETGDFDLLQKRLGETAIKDRWEQGVAIPGVAVVHVPKLSITKI